MPMCMHGNKNAVKHFSAAEEPANSASKHTK